MPFRNDILAGEYLIRSGIKSSDFVSGVSGWRVGRDGSAEFNGLTSRGGFQTPGGYQMSDSGLFVPVQAAGTDILTAHYDDGNQEGIYWQDASQNTKAYIERRSDGNFVIYNEQGANIVLSTGGADSAVNITSVDATGGNLFATGRVQGRVPSMRAQNPLASANTVTGTDNWKIVGTWQVIQHDTGDTDVITRNGSMSTVTIVQPGLYMIYGSIMYPAGTTVGSVGGAAVINPGASVTNVPAANFAASSEHFRNTDNAHWTKEAFATFYALQAGDIVRPCMFFSGSVAISPTDQSYWGIAFLGWADALTVPNPPSTVPPPPPPTSIVKTFKATDGGCYRGFWDSGKVAQGNYGYGNNTGYYVGNSAAIRSALAGKTIDKVEVYVARDSSGGSSAAQPVGFIDHNIDSIGGSHPVGTLYGNIGSFAWGKAGWLTVSNSFGTRLQSGAAHWWGMLETSGSPYGTYYRPQSNSSAGQIRITYH